GGAHLGHIDRLAPPTPPPPGSAEAVPPPRGYNPPDLPPPTCRIAAHAPTRSPRPRGPAPEPSPPIPPVPRPTPPASRYKVPKATKSRSTRDPARPAAASQYWMLTTRSPSCSGTSARVAVSTYHSEPSATAIATAIPSPPISVRAGCLRRIRRPSLTSSHEIPE